MRAGWAPGGSARLGDSVICSRIGTMVASVAVRRWFELGCAEAHWLRQVQDPHISRAVDELHRDLRRAWTVDDLARVAAMSRSGFAVRFRDLLGQPPVAYLAAVRIDAAKQMLAHDDVTVTEISHRLGYGSDAGFSRAFQRHEGGHACTVEGGAPTITRPVRLTVSLPTGGPC
ncbi:MAG: helix-turn-helix transcriptional regulator [Rhodococcus sp. (in: high G+C Gram-positive bacteria)]